MRWFHMGRPVRHAEHTAVEETSATQPDHAWKALTVTNDWVRHADTKTGVTMAFVGVTAAALFNLVGERESWTCALSVATWVSFLAIAGSLLSAGLALVPRVKRKDRKEKTTGTGQVTADDAVNLLFFGDVARSYGDDLPSYREVLGVLTSDPVRLTGQVADQIHANAHIAAVKFRWANWAVVYGLVAAVAVGVVALLTTTGW